MAFLRSMARNDNRNSHRIYETCEQIREFSILDTFGMIRWTQYEPFCNLVMELWVSHYSEQLQTLENKGSGKSAEILACRRENKHKKLRRVCPGSSSKLGLLRNSTGDILADDQHIADALADYCFVWLVTKLVREGSRSGSTKMSGLTSVMLSGALLLTMSTSQSRRRTVRLQALTASLTRPTASTPTRPKSCSLPPRPCKPTTPSSRRTSTLRA